MTVHDNGKLQVRRADQALYHHELSWSSLGSDSQSTCYLHPPANIVQNLLDTKQNHQPNKRKFYICADGPHTHTCSEISYRITDVECIERAQTIP